jgi:hypothetical protein
LVTAPFLAQLRKGNFDKSVQVLTAHNSFEGGLFFDPTVENDDEFRRWINSSLPGLSSASLDDLIRSVYPAQFDGSLGYVDQESRQMMLWAESV